MKTRGVLVKLCNIYTCIYVHDFDFCAVFACASPKLFGAAGPLFSLVDPGELTNIMYQ